MTRPADVFADLVGRRIFLDEPGVCGRGGLVVSVTPPRIWHEVIRDDDRNIVAEEPFFGQLVTFDNGGQTVAGPLARIRHLAAPSTGGAA